MLNELTALGLTSEEAKVYLAILELGGSYASNIARKAGINRATCYHTINNLKEKGLINSYTKGKILWFNAENPQKIINIQQEKVNIAKNLIPELLSISNTLTFKPKIRFYEGLEGIKTIFEDVLTTQEEVLGYTNIKSLGELLPEYFKNFCKHKVEKKIKTRYLAPVTGEGTDLIDEFYPKDYDRNLVEMLLVNKDEFFFENEIAIYENKVAVLSLNPNELIGLLIESPTFAKSMRSIFNLAWLGATAFVAK
ncbi:MAG: helix-turn-helix domain-containing protein [Patescibacteria group bacterium]